MSPTYPVLVPWLSSVLKVLVNHFLDTCLHTRLVSLGSLHPQTKPPFSICVSVVGEVLWTWWVPTPSSLLSYEDFESRRPGIFVTVTTRLRYQHLSVSKTFLMIIVNPPLSSRRERREGGGEGGEGIRERSQRCTNFGWSSVSRSLWSTLPCLSPRLVLTVT